MTAVGIWSAVVLLAIWLGYPAAVRLVGAFARRPVRSAGPEAGGASIVLASCADAATIRRRVENLLASSFEGPLEVIVALDVAGGRATAPELGDLGSTVSVVVGDVPGGKAATLNAGVRRARYATLVFADSAQSFDACAVSELVGSLGDPRIGAVSGQLELPADGRTSHLIGAYWRYERWLRHWEARVHSSIGVTGAIYAMRRQLWKPLPAGLILDDLYVPMRLVLGGWRIGFNERARAFDARSFSTGQEYRRKVRTLTGNLQLCAWLPAVTNPFRNPAWVQFGAHKLLRLATPYLLIGTMVGVGGWVLDLVRTSAVAEAYALPASAAGAGLLLVPMIRRTVFDRVASFAALQLSILTATVHGLRGRWDVWQ